jgi:hypothetical protein
MRQFIPAFLFLISLSAWSLSANAQAGQQKVNGTWNITVETSAGSGSPVFVFKHDTDTTFSGTYTGMFGEAAVTGTLKGSKVHFEFTANGNLLEYNGTVDGNTMKGTVKLGTMAEGTFTGKKKE